MSRQYIDYHDLVTLGPGIRLYSDDDSDSDVRIFTEFVGKGPAVRMMMLKLSDGEIDEDSYDRQQFNQEPFYYDPKHDVGVMMWGAENATRHHGCQYAYALVKDQGDWSFRGGCQSEGEFVSAHAALQGALDFWRDAHGLACEGDGPEAEAKSVKLILEDDPDNSRITANREIRQLFKDIYAKIPRSEKPATAPVKKAAKKAKKSKRTRR